MCNSKLFARATFQSSTSGMVPSTTGSNWPRAIENADISEIWADLLESSRCFLQNARASHGYIRGFNCKSRLGHHITYTTVRQDKT